MGFGSKVDYGARLVLGKQCRHQSGIANVALDEDVPGIVLQAGQVLQIAGVAEFVQIDNGFIRLRESST